MDVVVMPQLGETVVEGTITVWAKAVGDAVAIDDTLFEVSTEKVDTEVPSAVAGYLREVLVEEGATVPVGVPVAIVTTSADEPYDPPSPTTVPSSDASATPLPAAAVGDAPVTGTPVADTAPASRGEAPTAVPRRSPSPNGSASTGFLSPAVRRLLGEHGLAPSEVVGSGRDGRITRNDVLAVAAQRRRAPAGAPVAPGPTPRLEIGPDDEAVELSRARLATAEHLHRSTQTAAHALVVVEVDWSAVEAARTDAIRSYLPFVARATIDALGSFPHLNASFDVDRLLVHRRVHLGVAVDVTHEALLVPVVHDADALRLPALATSIATVADQARRRRLPGDAFDGGTFTITNVGAYGTVLAAPIINPPQVAILSTDGVAHRPVAVGDGAGGHGIAVRPTGNLSLSFDHRAVDGAYAAAFLAEVRTILQERDWAAEVSA